MNTLYNPRKWNYNKLVVLICLQHILESALLKFCAPEFSVLSAAVSAEIRKTRL